MSTEKEKQRQRDRRSKLREQGLCSECGKGPPSPGKARCADCAYRSAQAVSRSRKKLKPIRQAQGLCYCGRPAVEGKKLCENCQDKATSKYYRDKARGRCAYCGNPAIEGLTRCQSCTDVARSKRHQLKVEVFDAYGGPKCACCGESNFMFLTLDHIENNGKNHRIEVGRTSVYRRLKQEGFPPGFQVLCFNCNIGKHLNGGVCPHHA